MNTTTWIALAITGPILCGALLLLARRLWHQAEARLQHHISTALAEADDGRLAAQARSRALDLEYQTLVANAQHDR